MNLIWTAILVVSVLLRSCKRADGGTAVTQGVVKGAEDAVIFAFGLIGALAFWSGMLKVAEASAAHNAVARALSPLVRLLFPSIPPDDPANASVLMAIIVNSRAWQRRHPLGLKAMQDLAGSTGTVTKPPTPCAPFLPSRRRASRLSPAPSSPSGPPPARGSDGHGGHHVPRHPCRYRGSRRPRPGLSAAETGPMTELWASCPPG